MTRIGSLCSGYGGLELGLMQVVAGAVAWHVENDPHPAAVLERRFPTVPNFGDVKTTDWTTVEPIDILTAGYPCQPFSAAGKRLGVADERHLWPDVAHAIGVLRPGVVVLENVANHLVLGFDVVLADLAALGYDATWGLVRAADAGAPHGRSRLFAVATDTRGETVRQRPRLRESGEGRIGWGRPDHDGPQAPADLPGDGWNQGRPEPTGQLGGPDAAERRDDAAADPDGWGREIEPELDSEAAALAANWSASGRDPDGHIRPQWGKYEAAIRRWEAILGRPAPMPVERGGRGGYRLNPRLNEWMMGLPDGWVTDVLPRNPALKCLGNGVVPRQAALALRALLPLAEAVAA